MNLTQRWEAKAMNDNKVAQMIKELSQLDGFNSERMLSDLRYNGKLVISDRKTDFGNWHGFNENLVNHPKFQLGDPNHKAFSSRHQKDLEDEDVEEFKQLVLDFVDGKFQ